MIHRLFLGYCNFCHKELKVSRIEGIGPTVWRKGDFYYCNRCYWKLDKPIIGGYHEFLLPNLQRRN